MRCKTCNDGTDHVYENLSPIKEKEEMPYADLSEANAATINELRKVFKDEIKEEKYEVSDDA